MTGAKISRTKARIERNANAVNLTATVAFAYDRIVSAHKIADITTGNYELGPG